MKTHQRHIDFVVKTSAESVVRIGPEWTDRWRERQHELIEGSALLRARITDFLMLHAVFPRQIGRNFSQCSVTEIIPQAKTEVPFFLLALEVG